MGEASHEIVAENGISVKESVTLKERHYLSISHIQGADVLARLAAKVEDEYDGKWSDQLFHEHRAYVMGSVFAAIAFLEATINELFADAVDYPDGVKQLDEKAQVLMAGMSRIWAEKAPFSMLEKFQIAVILAGKKEFDKGQSPCQDVASVVKLRNALVHYDPKWITTISDADPEAVTVQELEPRLQGKFSCNPLSGKANAFFPDRCLSHGCAQWAISSCLTFADEFFSRIGMRAPYEHIRSRLDARKATGHESTSPSHAV